MDGAEHKINYIDKSGREFTGFSGQEEIARLVWASKADSVPFATWLGEDRSKEGLIAISK